MNKPAIISILNDAQDMSRFKQEIMSIARMLLDDTLYKREDAAVDLIKVAVEMTESERDIIRQLKEKTPSVN